MISVISPLFVLNKDLLEQTVLFFEDLKKGLSQEDEIIIVDNGSTIGRDKFIEIADIYIRTPKNLGYGVAINLGVKLAKEKYFLFPNNDMRVGADWSNKMLEKFHTDSKIGVVSCYGSHMIPSTDTAFNGIFWMIKRETWEEVGEFDKNFIGGAHDSDYCLRVVKNGWDIETAEFFYNHPKRRSTYSQPEFQKICPDPAFRHHCFKEKWGFNETEWYKQGIKNRS